MIKVEYVEGNTIEELKEETNKVLEALQVNTKVKVLNVDTTKIIVTANLSQSSYVSTITYLINEDKEILKEEL